MEKTNEEKFKSEMNRAKKIRFETSNANIGSYYLGYMRGLRRAYQGENFGTEEEHLAMIESSKSDDEFRAEIGRGYCDGLKFFDEKNAVQNINPMKIREIADLSIQRVAILIKDDPRIKELKISDDELKICICESLKAIDTAIIPFVCMAADLRMWK